MGLGLLLALSLGGTAFAGRAGQVRARAFQLLNQGVSAYNRADYADAVLKLRESASMALNSFRANYYLGLALIGLREYPQALDALEVALDLDPTHLQALVATGDAHLKLGNIDEARAAYARALKLRPGHAAALDGIGRSYESQAQDDRAIDYFRRAILSDKGFAPAYTHLGDLYLRQERYHEAVELLEEAIEVRPGFAPGLNRLARAYGKLGLHNEAVAKVQRAIDLEPGSPEHPTTLGWLQLGQGFVGTAEGSFGKALALNADLPAARLGLAEVARRRGAYEKALAEVERVLRPDTRLPPRLQERVLRFRDEVLAEQAEVAALEARVASGEASAEDRGKLARFYAGREVWDDAAELERGAPASPEQQARLAFLLFQAGRYHEAQELYARLAEQTGDPTHRFNRGVALARLGDDAAAAAAYEGVLSSSPERLEALLYLGNAQLRLGRTEVAARSYKAFLDAAPEGEDTERVRRILRQIAPALVPAKAPALPPPPPPAQGEQPEELEQP